MANVVVENQDFETLVKHYDRDNALFYADPPYLSTEDMYEVSFNRNDHLRLKETLSKIKGKFCCHITTAKKYGNCTRGIAYSIFPVNILWRNVTKREKNSKNF